MRFLAALVLLVALGEAKLLVAPGSGQKQTNTYDEAKLKIWHIT